MGPDQFFVTGRARPCEVLCQSTASDDVQQNCCTLDAKRSSSATRSTAPVRDAAEFWIGPQPMRTPVLKVQLIWCQKIAPRPSVRGSKQNRAGARRRTIPTTPVGDPITLFWVAGGKRHHGVMSELVMHGSYMPGQ